MAQKIAAPATYDEIRNAATRYHDPVKGYRAYNRKYCAINTDEFREAVLNGCDNDAAERIREFLAGFGCHTDNPTRDRLQQHIQRNIVRIKQLATFDLVTTDLAVGSTTVAMIEETYERLLNIRGVSDAVAAKTLAIINPDLFVMWDGVIWLAYHEASPRNRTLAEVYVEFLRKMQNSAVSIIDDTRANYFTERPAKRLSKELDVNPPLTLAKFIDEYNFVNTRR